MSAPRGAGHLASRLPRAWCTAVRGGGAGSAMLDVTAPHWSRHGYPPLVCSHRPSWSVASGGRHQRHVVRAKEAHLQAETADAVRSTCADVGLPLLDVPAGLDVAGRVAWVTRRVDPLLTAASG